MYRHNLTFYSEHAFHTFANTTHLLEGLGTLEKKHLDTETGYYCVTYCSEQPIDKEYQIDIQGGYHLICKNAFNLEEDEDEDDYIALDSQVGKDAARLLARYFPEASLTSLQGSYHKGYFVGDYSITIKGSVAHPIVHDVEFSFSHEDVPGRPQSWEELMSCTGIEMFLCGISLINPANGKPLSYGLPGIYQEEMEAWYKQHGDGNLYGRVITPNMFIITTEAVSDAHEEIEQAARHIDEIANVKHDKEKQELLAAIESAPQGHADLMERIKGWGLDSRPFRVSDLTKLND